MHVRLSAHLECIAQSLESLLASRPFDHYVRGAVAVDCGLIIVGARLGIIGVGLVAIHRNSV
jgi:hypothetical protein